MVGDRSQVADTLTKTPVRPVDAASLLIVRCGSSGVEVLMGRRPENARFAAGVYVFPGGKVERADFKAKATGALKRSIVGKLAVAASRQRASAFAKAAVREAYEETGLLLGAPGDVGDVNNASWSEIRRKGLAPALGKMDYVGRAITYARSPIRFHARFFCTKAKYVSGEIRGNGELEDLDWHPVGKALSLPIFDVTEFILSELRRHLKKPSRRKPVLSYKKGIVQVDYR